MIIIQGCFTIYVQPTNKDTPWIIRYADPKMPEGINELLAAEWVSQVLSESFCDEFLDGRLGRYQVKIPSALMLFDKEKKKAYFTP